MAGYNRDFKLDLKDMDIIETALRAAESSAHSTSLDPKAIHEVLGKLHNQKRFFRPTNEVYISG